jgi:uncharacterized protein
LSYSSHRYYKSPTCGGITDPLIIVISKDVFGLTISIFFALIFLVSLAAGLVGSLTGLGGGVVLVPALVLAFGCDIHYAAGASLISVIATSSGAAAAYLRDGYSNLRIAMFLELATTCGAIAGAYLAGRLNGHIISVVFGLVLMHSSFTAFFKKEEDGPSLARDSLSRFLKLEGSYPTERGELVSYWATRVVPGFILMILAGALSGLLGIGSGALKVLAMDQIMGLPFKVSTTTSNLMIGVTAAASSGIYFRRGWVDPTLAAPVVLGVVAGSFLGARLLPRIKSLTLRKVFAMVLLASALEMIVKGMGGRL